MIWFIPILISLALSALTYLLSKKGVDTSSPRDETLNEISFSKVRAGLPLPIVFGEARVGGVYLDLDSALDIETHEEKLGKGQSYRTYTHRIWSYLGLCIGPAHKIRWIEAGQNTRDLGSTMRNTGTDYDSMTNPVDGIDVVRVYWGNPDQAVDGADVTERGEWLTNYPGICYAILYFNMGDGSSPPSTSWMVRSFVKPIAELDATLDDLGVADLSLIVATEQNLVQILYYMLTEEDYFFGLESSQVDKDSFIAAGQVLVTEGLGGSVKIESGTTDLYNTVEDILAWIGGSLVEKDHVVYLKLRRETDAALYDLVADDVIADSISLKRGSWFKTPAGIIFSWSNKDRDCEQGTLMLRDPAAEEMGSSGDVKRISCGIIAPMSMAKIVASRMMKLYTFPTGLLRFTTTRSELTKEDLVTITYEKYKLNGNRYRVVGRTSIGNGLYQIDCVEDLVRSVLVMDMEEGTGSSGAEPEPVMEDLQWQIWEGQFRKPTPVIRRRILITPKMGDVEVVASVDDVRLTRNFYRPLKLGVLKTEISAGTSPIDEVASIDCDYENSYTWVSVNDLSWYTGALAILLIEEDGSEAEVIYAKTVVDDSTTASFTNLLRGRELSVPGSVDAPENGIVHSAGAWVVLLGRCSLGSSQVMIPDEYYGVGLRKSVV